jgi:hypothetical protein
VAHALCLRRHAAADVAPVDVAAGVAARDDTADGCQRAAAAAADLVAEQAADDRAEHRAVPVAEALGLADLHGLVAAHALRGFAGLGDRHGIDDVGVHRLLDGDGSGPHDIGILRADHAGLVGADGGAGGKQATECDCECLVHGSLLNFRKMPGSHAE